MRDDPGSSIDDMAIQKQKGFSLVELLISVSIIATALLLFIGIFFAMFKASQKGVDLTVGTVVAESMLSRYLYSYQALYDTESYSGLNALPENGETYSSTTTLNRTIFTYEISSQSVGSSDNLRKVDIKVWWWDYDSSTGQEYREGFGRLSVCLSRLVYTNNKIEVKSDSE